MLMLNNSKIVNFNTDQNKHRKKDEVWKRDRNNLLTGKISIVGNRGTGMIFN